MDVSDDLPPPRRPLLFPVVIATVFLSIIGMSAGLVLGSRRAADESAGRQQQQQQTPVRTQTPSPTTPPGPACRPETQAMAQEFDAAGTLRIVLQLRTRTSAVWICEDEGGRLYYHANRGGEDAEWVEGETALFLADVREQSGEYVATASDGTTFSVTEKRLYIVHKDGEPETQEAVG